jgi:hypothetical protein
MTETKTAPDHVLVRRAPAVLGVGDALRDRIGHRDGILLSISGEVLHYSYRDGESGEMVEADVDVHSVDALTPRS